MKALAVLIFSLVATAAFGKCGKSVDPKKVVLFVDTNGSTQEAAYAEKAACTRGEMFLRLPRAGQPPMSSQLFRQEVKELAQKNVAVTSLIVSGHDGGGSFHGQTGSLDKEDVTAAIQDAYKGKKALAAEFSSVLLWGCWSMGPSEVDYWRKSFPSLKIAAGFYDVAPANTRPASHTIMYDLLVKEQQIVHQKDLNALKRSIASVQNINTATSAVYTEGACKENMYYFVTDGSSGDRKAGSYFLDFDKSFECEMIQDKIEKYEEYYMDYLAGFTPLPADDNSQSPVREMYSFVRANSKCIQQAGSRMNGDVLLLLRFFENVKKNFVEVFGGQARQALKVLADSQIADQSVFPLDMETLGNKNRQQINSMIRRLNSYANSSQLRDPERKVARLAQTMNTYLYALDPACMPALPWHEHTPGRKPQAICKY